MKAILLPAFFLSLSVQAQTFSQGPNTVFDPFANSNPSGGSTFVSPSEFGVNTTVTPTGDATNLNTNSNVNTGTSTNNNTTTFGSGTIGGSTQTQPGGVTNFGQTTPNQRIPGTIDSTVAPLNTAPSALPDSLNSSDTFQGSLILDPNRNQGEETRQSQEDEVNFSTQPQPSTIEPAPEQ